MRIEATTRHDRRRSGRALRRRRSRGEAFPPWGWRRGLASDRTGV